MLFRSAKTNTTIPSESHWVWTVERSLAGIQRSQSSVANDRHTHTHSRFFLRCRLQIPPRTMTDSFGRGCGQMRRINRVVTMATASRVQRFSRETHTTDGVPDEVRRCAETTAIPRAEPQAGPCFAENALLNKYTKRGKALTW